MNALLDTHALLWWITDDRRLSRGARAIIADGDIAISVVSLWEIEIKRRLGRIEADTLEIMSEVSRTDGFHLLDVTPSHVATLVELPLLHGDPFDRMLVAQSLRERMPLVTRDKALGAYPIDRGW